MKKENLISALTDGRRDFLNQLTGISREEMEIPGMLEQWSLKDLLIHLARCEAELVKLLWQAKQGITPTTAHFGQETIDAQNERWYQESKSRPMDMVWEDFLAVRQQTIRRVKEFEDSQLNDQQYYPWLKGKTLWEWIAGDSFEHEAEHAQDIRSWKSSDGKTS
ncbi:MAG TPA: ClbS/DfsB family four-helix bundle protein [Anaerolineales bacterium]|nr:ClbS/DfsB family four-helix bundle protein [Anaerolineales bacterium]